MGKSGCRRRATLDLWRWEVHRIQKKAVTRFWSQQKLYKHGKQVSKSRFPGNQRDTLLNLSVFITNCQREDRPTLSSRPIAQKETQQTHKNQSQQSIIVLQRFILFTPRVWQSAQKHIQDTNLLQQGSVISQNGWAPFLTNTSSNNIANKSSSKSGICCGLFSADY